jgi:TIR domain-containing protein
MSQHLFLSHAVDDKPLADALKQAIVSSVGLNPTELFYSSGTGSGIPSGKNFVDYMAEKMRDAKAVVALITPNYLASQFCMAELGAVWYGSKDFFPLCSPAIDRAKLKATLTGIQVEKIDDASSLADLLQRLCASFKREHIAAACTAEIDTFMAGLDEVLAQLPEPAVMEAEKYRELEKVNQHLAQQVATARGEVVDLRERFKELQESKTAEEAAAIIPSSGVEGEVNDLLQVAIEAVGKIGSAERRAIPYQLKGEGMPWPDAGTYDYESARQALDDGFFLDYEDGLLHLNFDWLEIEKAVAAVSALQDLLRNLGTDDEEWFRATYKVPPDLRQGAAFDRLI